MAKILGINFGTTDSCMAVMQGGLPLVLENAEGKRTTPSAVAFTKTGELLVGDDATRQAVTNPCNTIHSIKRFMGRKFDEVQEEITLVPYKVVSGHNGDAVVEVEVGGKPTQISPPEIAAYILCKLKLDAELLLGEQFVEAVITVPACFNDSQRQATEDAGSIAGLKVLSIINEPTAASLAYGLDKTKNEQICVYDLGGGALDVSVLEVGDGLIEVKATNGDTHLGGDDWDSRIMNWILDEFKKEHGIDLGKQPEALQRIKEESGKAKIALSSAQAYEVSLPSIAADASGRKDLALKLSRTQFEQMCEDIFQRAVAPCRRALADAGITTSSVDKVVLVGGSTRIPRIQKLVKEFFNKDAKDILVRDEVVAHGAAVQGGILTGEVKDILLLDLTPLSFGIETRGGAFTKLIERNTTIPTRKSETFSTPADNQTSVEIKVYQGEREMAKDNRMIGAFQFVGIPPAPRGVAQIEVTFDVNGSGILNISAKDRATGKEQQITISASASMSKVAVSATRKNLEAYELEYCRRKGLSVSRPKPTPVIARAQRAPISEEARVSSGAPAASDGRVEQGPKVQAVVAGEKTGFWKKLFGGSAVPKPSGTLTPPPRANVKGGPAWYFAEDKARCLRQVVLISDPRRAVKSRFSALALPGSFIELIRNPLITGLFPMSGCQETFLLVRTDCMVEEVAKSSLQISFSFLHLPTSGLVAIHVSCVPLKAKAKKGWLEQIYGLDHDLTRGLVENAVKGEALHVVHAGEGGMRTRVVIVGGEKTGDMEGPLCKFDLDIPYENNCRSVLAEEWDAVLRHHRSIRNPDFQAAGKRLYELLPEDVNPIRPRFPFEQFEHAMIFVKGPATTFELSDDVHLVLEEMTGRSIREVSLKARPMHIVRNSAGVVDDVAKGTRQGLIAATELGLKLRDKELPMRVLNDSLRVVERYFRDPESGVEMAIFMFYGV